MTKMEINFRPNQDSPEAQRERLNHWLAVLQDVADRYRPERSVGNIMMNIRQELEALCD